MLLTREELQDRLFALHRASLELVRNVSLETLLERIASLACEQAGAKYAAVGVLGEGGTLKRFITVGMTADEMKAIPYPPRGKGLIGALMHAEGNIRLADLRSDPRAVGFPPGHPRMRSFLGVPIRLAEQQLGQIYLTEKIGAPEFTADDETIIEMLAAYAGVAIENARLYERLREHDRTLALRNEELNLLNQTGAALSSSLELDEILNQTLALLMAHFTVEAGEIFLMEGDGETLRLVLHRGEAPEAFWTRNRFRVGEGMVGRAAATRQPVISNHIEEEDERITRQAVIEAGFKQIVCIPLMARGEVVGVLTFATRKRKAIARGELMLLVSVAAWAGTAIENARLHQNARRLAVMEERERIGMDLHDGIIQSIYAVGLTLENARASLNGNENAAREYLSKAMDGLNRTIRDIRNYILDLRPRQLSGSTLVEGLTRLVAEFRQNTTTTEIVLSCPTNDPVDRLPDTHAMALFHICQEALANVAKHAEAQKVGVELWTTSDRVLLEVHDDGRGFDPDVTSRTVGHGLSNMQTRVANVGGDIDITSAPGEGTTILAWVPRKTSPPSA